MPRLMGIACFDGSALIAEIIPTGADQECDHGKACDHFHEVPGLNSLCTQPAGQCSCRNRDWHPDSQQRPHHRRSHQPRQQDQRNSRRNRWHARQSRSSSGLQNRQDDEPNRHDHAPCRRRRKGTPHYIVDTIATGEHSWTISLPSGFDLLLYVARSVND